MWRAVGGVLMVSLAVGCSGGNTADPEPDANTLPRIEATEPGAAPVEYRHLTLTVSSPDGERSESFRVYDAADQVSRSRGLMFMTDLPEDAGMLFRFPEPRTGGFWMKNTLIPLSIAYADDTGVIGAILDMQPCDADPCPSYRPDEPYVYALEVNEGGFDDRGIEEGWRIDIPADLPPPPA